MRGDDLFEFLVPSYFDIDIYEILILQNPQGDLITIKVECYDE